MRAVIYARYSSDNQREESIDGQLRDCKNYAKYNDIEIVGEYIDRAMTAKSDNRPDFQRMIRDKRLTRENLNDSFSKKLITDKQNYFILIRQVSTCLIFLFALN